jgi:hypothetical protein
MFLMGVVIKTGPGLPLADSDGIGTEADMRSLLTGRYPGNPNWGHLRKVYVSSQRGGAIDAVGTDFVCDAASTQGPIACTFGDAAGDCSGDCDRVNFFADERLPLFSLSGAHDLFERNGCGIEVLLDADDRWDNLSIGHASDGQHGFGRDANNSDYRLDCPNGDVSRLGLVLAGYPAGEVAKVNFCWQTDSGLTASPVTLGLAGTDCDVIADAVAGESNATVIGAAAQLNLDPDELIGGRALVTDDTDVGCAIAEGQIRNITDNDANTITVDTFAAVTDDCVFTIVPASAEEGVAINDREHFQFNNLDGGAGLDHGGVLMANVHIYNSFEANTVSNPNKDETTTANQMHTILWNVKVFGDLENGVTDGPCFHFNAPGAIWLIQSGCVDLSNMVGLNSSGSIFIAGGAFATTDASDVNFTTRVSAFHTAIFDSTFNANYPTNAGNTTVDALNLRCNVQTASECTTLIARSVFSGSAGATNAGIKMESNDADITAQSFKLLYSSLVRNDVPLAMQPEASSPYTLQLFMRATIFDENFTDIIQFFNNLEDINFDIQDMVYDDTEVGANDWEMSTATVSTLALAQDELDSGTDLQCCGGTCVDGSGANGSSTCFFGNSSDLANTDAAVGSSADTDRVSEGGCHESQTECYQTSTYAIDETLDSTLALPTSLLASGEAVIRWQLNRGAVNRDRGGAP